jgi:hypothetical protein
VAAESPKKPLVAPSAAVSSACWDQAVPGRVTHAPPPLSGLWQGARTAVVDPGTATEWPKQSAGRRRSSSMPSFFLRVFGQQEGEDEGGCQGEEAGP